MKQAAAGNRLADCHSKSIIDAFAGDDMNTRKSSGNTANDTGKTGNASGSGVKEARGPSYAERHGKHPPNALYKGPKDTHPPKQTTRRNSDKG